MYVEIIIKIHFGNTLGLKIVKLVQQKLKSVCLKLKRYHLQSYSNNRNAECLHVRDICII